MFRAEELIPIWYGGRAPGALRIVLSWVYRGLRWLVQLPYRLRLRRPAKLDVPVLVVGNLTVGGTGKTPLTIALVEQLRARGIAVGVISRGYGRRGQGVRLVDSGSRASDVGDEPLLIARRTKAPVAVGADRVAAARRLLSAVPLDLLIADDGLEHLALPRRAEIVVVDGERGYGNGRLLPAGPLRAPLSRLSKVDFIVRNGGTANAGEYAMHLQPVALTPMDGTAPLPLEKWRGRRAHVLAGVGNPDRVFASVRELGVDLVEHPRVDHVDYEREPPPHFDDTVACITTEKDAVKLTAQAGWHVLRVDAQISPDLLPELLRRLQLEPV